MVRRRNKTAPKSRSTADAEKPSAVGADEDSFNHVYKRESSAIKEALRKKYGYLSATDLEEIVEDAFLEFRAEIARPGFDVSKIGTRAFDLAGKKRGEKPKRERLLVRPENVPFPERGEDAESANRIVAETENQKRLEQDVRQFIESYPNKRRAAALSAFLQNESNYASRVAAKYGVTPGCIRNDRTKIWPEFEAYLDKRGHKLAGGWSLKEPLEKFAAAIESKPPRGAKRKARPIREVVKQLIDGEGKARIRRSQSPAPIDSQAPGLPEYVSTGFDALNTLLGGNGFIQGSTILIRGQPGTGKTTLGLQIAKHALDAGHAIVFASVEDEPDVLLNQVTQSFWRKDYRDFLGDSANCKVKDITSHFEVKVKAEAEAEAVDQWSRDAELSPSDLENFANHPEVIEELKNLYRRRVDAAVEEVLRSKDLEPLLREVWNELELEGNLPVVVVVDSLNALINGAAMRFRRAPDRQIMLAVLNSFRSWRRSRRGRVTVIFLVEDDAKIVDAAASYLADVVIELGTREVEHVIYEVADEASEWTQEMRFCRVAKGRGMPIQARSCAYEFVRDDDPENSGIVFLPTYAAPGVVSLFHENTPMREVIRSFRTHDVPVLFPQVLVQEFSRTALQRVFSLSSRRTSISMRHPMMLSNVDEYWLKRLKERRLVHPIPASELKMFAISPQDSEPISDSAPFISELENAKEHVFVEWVDGKKIVYGLPQIANVGMLVYRKDVLGDFKKAPPETWEEVEAICRELTGNVPHKLFLELTSYDTFLATALELGWAHGAFWRTVREGKKLRIQFDPGSGVENLIAALVRLKYWIFKLAIVPTGCSVDPEINRKQDWLFARHWYSTWVNICTHPSKVFEPGKYSVLPIPIDAGHKDRAQDKARHHSAWGEWYLAILRGSENIELGIELINNLMTARKITERARSGAGLPTVEEFYKLSAEENCPYTQLSFEQLRSRFFQEAKSRSDFDDYPRFARIFSAVLQTVATNPNSDVVETVKKGFLAIDPSYSWPDDIRDRVLAILSPDLRAFFEGDNSSAP